MNSRQVVIVSLGLALAACPSQPSGKLNQLTSFKVEVKGAFQNNGATRTPLTVVTACVKQYGSEAMVPAAVRGTKACKYDIPRGEIEFDLVAQALDFAGKPLNTFNNSVAFRVVPGDLAMNYATRWAWAKDGVVTATVRSLHQYGNVRVWVEDAPPKSMFDGGELVTEGLPLELLDAGRSYAAGASDVVYFDDQTLQSLQLPDGFDNRGSPFVGEFVTVGKNPESGETLNQSCTDDPLHDGQVSMMVVTGLDPAGFFVTDVSACRLIEKTVDSAGQTQVRTQQLPEPCVVALADGGTRPLDGPDGGAGVCEISRGACTSSAQCKRYLPSTFAHMFVYNYNFPDGLDQGDLIFTLSGSVQEFTSTSQMVFPGWTVAERVRQLPPSQWNKWMQYAPPVNIGGRICGWDDVPAAYITDALCGHNKRNLKMESLESGLVRIKSVRFPSVFDNCDFNSDGTVPFFCEQKPQGGDWMWGSCAFNEVEPESDRVERECTQACVLGYGAHDGQVCSERSTFNGFGQYIVELGLPGLGAAGLDDSLPQRYVTVAVPGTGDAGVPLTAKAGGYAQGIEVAIACDSDVHYHAGGDTVTVSTADPVIEANTFVQVRFGANESTVALQSTGRAAKCTVGTNVKARINVLTKDAIPELNPDCSETDADEVKAGTCKALHAATFDITGHLRHVQPARPRWMVIPRDVDDVCCHPGVGLTCPKPIKACTQTNN